MRTNLSADRVALRTGVIDIGSNSIRLVVFESLNRAPIVVFNEKVLARLGYGLKQGGTLDEESVACALKALQRFSAISKELKVGTLIAVATAAVREAADGANFVHRVQELCGIKVSILEGKEEARLSALGVMSGIPNAEGTFGDLGGSSLELAQLNKRTAKNHVTLPLGPFRLDEMATSKVMTKAFIQKELHSLAWLGALRGYPFYAVGGAWRAVAKTHMAHVKHPLRVVHQYTVPWRDMDPFLDLLARVTPSSLGKLGVISPRRIDTLSQAAAVLHEIGCRIQPSHIVFSAFGLREGCLYDLLPEAERARDPLIESCIAYGERVARFPGHFQLRDTWLNDLLTEAPTEIRRLARAAVAVSDLAWEDQPDYRAEEVLHRVLALPIAAIDHPGRVFLAMALFVRYGGDSLTKPLNELLRLLSEDGQWWARITGYALRLSYSFAAGAGESLARSRLRVRDSTLVMTISAGDRLLVGEETRRRIEKLATFLRLEPKIEIEESNS
ncbi:MAG: Ppx/GppA family phosphatase [Alphaproteobacteria bacterium]